MHIYTLVLLYIFIHYSFKPFLDTQELDQFQHFAAEELQRLRAELRTVHVPHSEVSPQRVEALGLGISNNHLVMR